MNNLPDNGLFIAQQYFRRGAAYALGKLAWVIVLKGLRQGEHSPFSTRNSSSQSLGQVYEWAKRREDTN